MSPEEEIGKLLRERGLTLGTVESATGGLIAHLITNVPGSSDYYRGSIIAYSNEAKTKVAGVRAATITKFGAVSPQVAGEMAAGGSRVLAAGICVADTGIAGPTGATPDKPVGLFYIGLCHRGETRTRKFTFSGTREQNKQAAARAVLDWVREYLLSLK